MTRVALVLASTLLALGCARRTQTREPRATVFRQGLPAPLRPEPAPIRANQPLLIEQYAIGRPDTWRFQPGGELVAAKREQECGIWELGSGAFLGPADASLGELDPCETWPGLRLASPREHADPIVLAPRSGYRLELRDDRFEVSAERFSLSSPARGGRNWSAAFSPEGDELAILVGEPRGRMRVDIWNLRSRSIRAVLDLEYEGRVERTWLDWSARSLSAVVVVGSVVCDYEQPKVPGCVDHWVAGGHEHVVNVWSTKADDPKPKAFFANLLDEEGDNDKLYFDPEQRWLFALFDYREPRMVFLEVLAEIPLGGADEGSGLDWEFDFNPCCQRIRVDLREWSDVVGSTFVEIAAVDSTYGYDYTVRSVSAETSLLTLRGLPDRSVEVTWTEGSMFDEVESYELGRVFVARDQILADAEVCPMPEMDELDEGEGEGYEGEEDGEEDEEDGEDGEEDEDYLDGLDYDDVEVVESGAGELPAYAWDEQRECRQTSATPPGCEIVDASWDATHLLLSCADRWLIVEAPEGARSIDLDHARAIARGTRDARVAWGPGGLAIVTRDEGLRGFFGAGGASIDEPAITDLHRALLDEELDLALVRDGAGLRALDLATFELGPPLAWSGPVEFAAFGPSPGQLALAGGDRLAVFDHRDGFLALRIDSGPIAGLAFRQDGQVLFVGHDRPLPELALDPATGDLVMAAQLDSDAFARFELAELDPSWRWAIEEDGTILRTFDGQAITLFDANSAMMESGWMTPPVKGSAQAPYDVPIRIGQGLMAPLHDVTEFPGQLERPDLIAEFFAGKPLPRPTLVLSSP